MINATWLHFYKGEKMRRTIIIILGIIILLLPFILRNTIFTANKQSVNTGKIKIITSIYPLAEFAKEVAGEWADINYITPQGSEPHDYEPSPQDIIAIRSAKMFLYNGNGMDAWSGKIEKDLQDSGVEVINMSRALGVENTKDPHFWLDPQFVKREIEILYNLFIKIDSAHKSDYQKNSKEYLAALDNLDKKYQRGFARCRLKEIIASHDAFSYLAKRYNLQTHYISGLSPDEEPSIKKITQMAALAASKNIKYIFYEKLVSPKIAQTIASEIGAKTLLLDPFEGLTKEEADRNKNYLSVMEENLINLRLGMECDEK